MAEGNEQNRSVHTGGGAYIEGNVNTGGGHYVNVYAHSQIEEINDYLSRAVPRLEAQRQQVVMRPPAPVQPYKFLDAFDIADHTIFFGRAAASAALFDKVMANRLTVLHARSGAGKSSLLQAGLGPKLVQAGRLPVYARAYGDPVMAIKRAVLAAAGGKAPELLWGLGLHEFLGWACKHLTTMDEMVVILDQFEAFFIDWPTGEHRRPLIDALADCVENGLLPVRFVIALRKDYYSDLSVFKVRLPQIFHHEMLLESMTPAEAEQAITGPVAKLGQPVSYELELLEILLSDLTHFEVELPHLQIICTQLYEALDADETKISLEAYEALDRAAGVLGGYLRRVLAQFGEEERKIAQAVLVALVSSEGTKRVLHYEALAEQVKVERATLDSVLARLVDGRLVQRDEVEGALVYEIAHEYLVPEIRNWFDQETLAAKRANELLAREVANWRVHGTLIPEERLTLLHHHRAILSVHSENAVQCLIHSVVRAGHHLEDWVELVGEAAESRLLDLLKRQDETIKGKAIEGLGILWKFDELKRLSHTDARVRQGTAEALGKLGDARAVEPLIAQLTDDDSGVRQGAAAALGELGDARAVEPLIAQLKDDDSGVRHGAVVALGMLGDARVVEPLIARLKDDDSGVRRGAAVALGKLADARAVEPLIARLKDDDYRVRRAAAVALGKLADARAVEPLIAQLKDDDSGVRHGAAAALGNLGEPAVEPLIARLTDDNAGVRHGATVALGKLGDSRAVEPLIARLTDDNAGVRHGATVALGKLGDSRAVEPLIARLTDDDYWVRHGAAAALLRIATPEALAAVKENESKHQE
jgi:HEAT repeat protein